MNLTNNECLAFLHRPKCLLKFVHDDDFKVAGRKSSRYWFHGKLMEKYEPKESKWFVSNKIDNKV